MELETLKQEYARLCAEVDGMPREEIQEELTKAGIDTKEIIENARRKIEFVKAVHAAKRGMVGGAEPVGAERRAEQEPRQVVRSSDLVSLAARWLEEATARREDVAREKALGAGPFYGDANIGYAECLEDKAAELKKWAGSEANRVLNE